MKFNAFLALCLVSLFLCGPCTAIFAAERPAPLIRTQIKLLTPSARRLEHRDGSHRKGQRHMLRRVGRLVEPA